MPAYGSSSGMFTGSPGTTLELGRFGNGLPRTLGPGSSVTFPKVVFPSATRPRSRAPLTSKTPSWRGTASFGGPSPAIGKLVIAGKAAFDTPATTQSLEFSSGNLALHQHTERHRPACTWTGGVMRGSGRTAALGGLAISGVTTMYDQRTLDNYTTATWGGGTITMADSSTINNLVGCDLRRAGRRQCQHRQRHHVLCPTPVYSANPPGPACWRPAASASIIAGAWRCGRDAPAGLGRQPCPPAPSPEAPGATLNFDGGTHTVAARRNDRRGAAGREHGHCRHGIGTLRVRDATDVSGVARPTLTIKPGATLPTLGATLTVEGGYVELGSGDPLNVVDFSFTRGTLTGARDLIVTRKLNWIGGTMGGSGRTVANDTLGIVSTQSSRHDLDGRRLENNGIATWDGRTIYAYHGAVLQNNASGTFEITGDGMMWWCNYVVTQYNEQKCSARRRAAALCQPGNAPEDRRHRRSALLVPALG